MKEQYPTLRSSFIPILWSSILGILSLIYFVSILIRKKEESRKHSIEQVSGHIIAEVQLSSQDLRKIVRMVFFTTVVLVLYCFLLFKVNFILNTIGLLFASLYINGERNLRKTIPLSVLGGIAFYMVFVKIMQIPL